MRPLLFAPLAVAASAPLAAQAFQLDPGTLILQDSGGVSAGTFDLIKTSPLGGELGRLTVRGLPLGFGNMVGIALLEDELWVIGNGALAGRVDLATGAFTQSFFAGTPGIEGLGAIGPDLLIGVYSSATVQRRTTRGDLVAEFSAGVAMTGIASDGDRIYCASYPDGHVYTFDQAGALVGVVPTDAGGFAVSGLAYDPSGPSLWIATGYGEDEVRRYALDGRLLAYFPAGSAYVNDLARVPSACVDLYVPELASGAPVLLAGEAPPGQPVGIAVALKTGSGIPLAIGSFCATSSLDPPIGVALFPALAGADGLFSVPTAVPPGLSGLTVHLQAFAAGSCPEACASAVVTRGIQ